MSLTIQFYSAEPSELVQLFSQDIASVEDRGLFDILETYPHADFSLHLVIPDDLNTLCSILNRYRPSIPILFKDICIDELWVDTYHTESLTLIAHTFLQEISLLSEQDIHGVAVHWTKTFSFTQPIVQMPTYQSVLQLHKTARDAVLHDKSLIFYIMGVPEFFSYLR